MKPALLAALTALALAPAAAAQQATPPAAVQQPTPPAAAPAPQKPVLPMAQARAFVCTDGNLVTLSHDQTAGILRGIRAGEEFTLQQQVGSKLPRFVNGSDMVVLAGETAILRRGREVRQTCHQIPAEPAAGVVWGTLTKLDRMALVPGTRAKVMLVDAARADAPAIEIGSTALVTTGNQVPLWFRIRFDPARALAPAAPQLQARILDPRGRLLYITDTANPIPADGKAPPSPIELRLVRTGNQ